MTIALYIAVAFAAALIAKKPKPSALLGALVGLVIGLLDWYDFGGLSVDGRIFEYIALPVVSIALVAALVAAFRR